MADEETPNDGTVNADVLARLLNLTVRRIQQLAREGIIPKGSRGRYPFAPSIKGYVTFLQQSTAEQADGREVNPDKLNQFQRRAYYAAESLKLKIGVDSGELVERAMVERDYARTFQLMASFLDILPDVVEREGVPAEVVNRLAHRIDMVRKDLRDRLQSFETPEDDANSNTATGT